MLSTELAYLSELTAWEECVNGSAELDPADQQVLTASLPTLCELARALIDAISQQQGFFLQINKL